MMNEPQVSFITVCYNGFKDTCELIESLQTHVHSVSYEIIVVDNASREDEATKIKELYSDIVTLRSESNLGFSGGNNLGIRVAKGAYIFLINNDTYVESDGFHYLTERLESQKNIGAVSPKIRFAFPPQNIQFAGFTSLSAITIRNEMTGFGCPDDGTFDTNGDNRIFGREALLFVEGAFGHVGFGRAGQLAGGAGLPQVPRRQRLHRHRNAGPHALHP